MKDRMNNLKLWFIIGILFPALLIITTKGTIGQNNNSSSTSQPMIEYSLINSNNLFGRGKTNTSTFTRTPTQTPTSTATRTVRPTHPPVTQPTTSTPPSPYP